MYDFNTVQPCFVSFILVLTGSYSVLPPLPGMAYQPMIKAEETLLIYNLQDNKTYIPYTDAMTKFLETGIKPDRVVTPMNRESMSFMHGGL